MTMKSVSITTITRGENGENLGEQTTNGWADDEGATVKFGLGFLPDIASADPADIKVAMTSITTKTAATLSYSVDEENSLQVLSLTYSE